MRQLILASLSTALLTASAHADLIVDVQDAQISVGGTGFVNVMIRSDGTDNLASFNYRFAITDLGAPVGDLRFANPQDLSEAADGSYVFAGDSGGISAFPENGPAFDQITGGDFNASFLDVTLGPTDVLLARLDVEHVLPSGSSESAALTDSFLISLVPGADTFALDSSFESVDFGLAEAGTVTFELSAVPEPSSALLICLPAFVISLRRRERV